MKRLVQWLHRLEDSVLVLLLLAMILLAGYDILARSIFGGGVSWIPPLLRVMVLWIGLLGALLATRSREHISIDLISRLGGPTLNRIASTITLLFAAVVCGLVGWFSGQYVQLAFEYQDIAFADIPAWPLQLIIPFTFGLMGLRFFIQGIAAATGKEQTA
ncbi:TRAP transporter small permease [Thalassolituus sp. UBA3500]|uniref:TRAP transporter small permease n=1 Tax=Thalassolituus sp. UBA3500 TaxID=1947664 RepID=UPI000C0EA909|nr:TRAP transporter small permease [Thalassolituus sp. UBA3500]MBN57998.1 C4-dicarboxylate ABC transporter permease [Oceanospirillaceae bacterium]|tara:strand:+ start:669 stop:1148 length:480 start_codon:yes stop_codon:yes gene_type:complete